MPPWNCCATRSSRASRWSSAAAGANQPQVQPDGSRRFERLAAYAGRGVITTATYPARDLGVHSGMGLMKAAALAPQAVLLPVDFDAYRRYSRMFKAAVAEVAPLIEDRGIDEIYIDLSDLPGAQDAIGHDPQGGIRALAQEIKNSVRRATGLTCSIGITPNKLLSKIASDLDKPDGLTLLTHDDLPTRIWPLPVRRVNGIGPKAAARLSEMGIRTVGELAACAPDELVRRFGRATGAWLHEAAHGRDERPLVTTSEPVSMSRETTFERDLHAVRDKAELSRVFTELAAEVSDDLRRKGYAGRTIGIKLRFDDFKTVTRDMTVAQPTDDAHNHPPPGGPVPEAGGPVAPHPAAGRAGRHAGAIAQPAGGRGGCRRRRRGGRRAGTL